MDDISLTKRTIQVRRLKGSDDSTHYLERDELAGLKRLQREQEPKSAYVFVNERGQPFGRMGIGRMIERAGEALRYRSPSMCTCLAFDGVRSSGQGHGHAAPTTLFGRCQHHQHGALHRDVAGAFQGHLAVETDIATSPPDVRFTPNSRHSRMSA